MRILFFVAGFSHRNQPTSIDLNAVRLCFQVFLEGDNRGKFTVPLNPVVSDPIYDKKAMSDLVICKLSDCSCTVAGGKEIILLCEKVLGEFSSIGDFELFVFCFWFFLGCKGGHSSSVLRGIQW